MKNMGITPTRPTVAAADSDSHHIVLTEEGSRVEVETFSKLMFIVNR